MHRMFGIEQGLNELDHGREHARHVTAGVVLGFGPKTLSSARSPTARSGQRDGINLVYAATHHCGDPRRGIPARPFLGVSRDARAVILQSIVDHLAR